MSFYNNVNLCLSCVQTAICCAVCTRCLTENVQPRRSTNVVYVLDDDRVQLETVSTNGASLPYLALPDNIHMEQS